MPSGPDLSHIDTWVFDLDNTLYPVSTNLFPQIDVRMKTFIADLLGVSLDEAFKIQKLYYHEHGTTLRGLMINHTVEPDAFLDYVHDIDYTILEPNPELRRVIKELPGRKLIHTNGSESHAEGVLDALSLEGCFEAIFDIRAGAYIPKPDPNSYERLLRSHALTPESAIMFEDLVKNLKPAAELGMVTVLVKHDSDAASSNPDIHCHHVIEDLTDWLKQAVYPRTVS
ncbi:MAG: pyrimidine 5'-nucleotidase [Rhodospirillaceae bacterium]|nr:pyrimidine 5'-nucleotidase [Rhodospirillaceae bacterium]